MHVEQHVAHAGTTYPHGSRTTGVTYNHTACITCQNGAHVCTVTKSTAAASLRTDDALCVSKKGITHVVHLFRLMRCAAMSSERRMRCAGTWRSSRMRTFHRHRRACWTSYTNPLLFRVRRVMPQCCFWPCDSTACCTASELAPVAGQVLSLNPLSLNQTCDAGLFAELCIAAHVCVQRVAPHDPGMPERNVMRSPGVYTVELSMMLHACHWHIKASSPGNLVLHQQNQSEPCDRLP